MTVGGLAWSLMRPLQPDRMVQLADAVETDHVRSLLNRDHLTDVLSSDKHTVKPWFAGKLPFAPPVTDLAADGFPLVGGRLDVLEHRTVALVYQRDKHMISLFIWPSDSAAMPPRAMSTTDGYHILHWVANGMEFWAVSDVESKELSRFAELQDAAATSAR